MINVRRGANCSKKSEKVRKNRKKFEKIGLLSDKKTTGYQFDFEMPGDDPANPRIMRARTSIIHDREGKESSIVTIIHDCGMRNI